MKKSYHNIVKTSILSLLCFDILYKYEYNVLNETADE